MKDRIDRLVSILFDQRIDLGSRDDAAMDLADHYEDDRALIALIEMGSDPNEDEMLAVSCGNSIAEIFVERNICNRDVLERLTHTAKWNAIDYLRDSKPEWIEEYDLEKLLG